MIFVDIFRYKPNMLATIDEAETRRVRRMPASTRLSPQIDARITELMEIQDDDRSGVLRRLIKRGLAAYELDKDLLLGEFVERWRGLNNNQRHLLISFADSMLRTIEGIQEYPKEAEVPIPILTPPKPKK